MERIQGWKAQLPQPIRNADKQVPHGEAGAAARTDASVHQVFEQIGEALQTREFISELSAHPDARIAFRRLIGTLANYPEMADLEPILKQAEKKVWGAQVSFGEYKDRVSSGDYLGLRKIESDTTGWGEDFRAFVEANYAKYDALLAQCKSIDEIATIAAPLRKVTLVTDGLQNFVRLLRDHKYAEAAQPEVIQLFSDKFPAVAQLWKEELSRLRNAAGEIDKGHFASAKAILSGEWKAFPGVAKHWQEVIGLLRTEATKLDDVRATLLAITQKNPQLFEVDAMQKALSYVLAKMKPKELEKLLDIAPEGSALSELIVTAHLAVAKPLDLADYGQLLASGDLRGVLAEDERLLPLMWDDSDLAAAVSAHLEQIGQMLALCESREQMRALIAPMGDAVPEIQRLRQLLDAIDQRDMKRVAAETKTYREDFPELYARWNEATTALTTTANHAMDGEYRKATESLETARTQFPQLATEWNLILEALNLARGGGLTDLEGEIRDRASTTPQLLGDPLLRGALRRLIDHTGTQLVDNIGVRTSIEATREPSLVAILRPAGEEELLGAARQASREAIDDIRLGRWHAIEAKTELMRGVRPELHAEWQILAKVIQETETVRGLESQKRALTDSLRTGKLLCRAPEARNALRNLLIRLKGGVNQAPYEAIVRAIREGGLDHLARLPDEIEAQFMSLERSYTSEQISKLADILVQLKSDDPSEFVTIKYVIGQINAKSVVLEGLLQAEQGNPAGERTVLTALTQLTLPLMFVEEIDLGPINDLIEKYSPETT